MLPLITVVLLMAGASAVEAEDPVPAKPSPPPAQEATPAPAPTPAKPRPTPAQKAAPAAEPAPTEPLPLGEPRVWLGLWGGWAGAALRQVAADRGGERAAAGLHLGAEAGFVLVRDVMVETSGGKPRDIWLGTRLGFLRPGEISGSSATVSTSLTTVLFGGWFQGGDVDGFHGWVSLFAGPALVRGEIRDLGGSSQQLTGRSFAYETELGVGYPVTKSLVVFLGAGYHWIRVEELKADGKPVLRPNGLAALYDFSGANVHVGVKWMLRSR